MYQHMDCMLSEIEMQTFNNLSDDLTDQIYVLASQNNRCVMFICAHTFRWLSSLLLLLRLYDRLCEEPAGRLHVCLLQRRKPDSRWSLNSEWAWSLKLWVKVTATCSQERRCSSPAFQVENQRGEMTGAVTRGHKHRALMLADSRAAFCHTARQAGQLIVIIQNRSQENTRKTDEAPEEKKLIVESYGGARNHVCAPQWEVKLRACDVSSYTKSR